MTTDSKPEPPKQAINGAGWYKRYPRDFLEGTALLPFELKCAYALLLDLIYIQNGRLPDDARYIAGVLGCSVRKWNSIRQALLENEKIYINGAFIANFRADKLLITAKKTRDNNAENAAKRWARSPRRRLPMPANGFAQAKVR